MIDRLSILICTMPLRSGMFEQLYSEIMTQWVVPQKIEIRAHHSESKSIGCKRNELLEDAEGEYVCFIDDDDKVSKDYVKLLLEAAESGCDCASLKGEYSINSKFDGIFEHSLKYKAWKTTNREIKYERYPNHLNMIRSSIAKQFKFPEINHGEDHDWSKQIHESGLLKSEFYIPEIIYYYRKITKNV